MEKKSYSIKELSTILGCSVTAVQKKIKADVSNNGIKRYKNRYDVIENDGKMRILLTDEELEQEKRLSKGFNKGAETSYKTADNEDIIDVEPIKYANKQMETYNLTERYIERFETTFKEFYNELRERDKQVLLITTSEQQKEYAYAKANSDNKLLSDSNKILTKKNSALKIVLAIISTLFVMLLGLVYNGYNTQKVQIVKIQKLTDKNNDLTHNNTVLTTENKRLQQAAIRTLKKNNF